jgi:hypothetical protein
MNVSHSEGESQNLEVGQRMLLQKQPFQIQRGSRGRRRYKQKDKGKLVTANEQKNGAERVKC